MVVVQRTATATAMPTKLTTRAGAESKLQRPSEIIYRDARYGELPAIARVMSLAFWDDHIFGAMIHPHREEYPLDSDLYWLRRARINFWDYRYKFLVAVVPGEGGDSDEVVGIAQWERLGDGGKTLECAWYDPRNILKSASSLAMSLHEKIWPNRAADPEKENIIERTYPFLDEIWAGERAESWYLAFLAVHPDYQGRGIGRTLVQWGLDRAQQDGVVASVISALGRNSFYQMCGFDEQYRKASDGDGNPLAGTEGSDMFWKWPNRR